MDDNLVLTLALCPKDPHSSEQICKMCKYCGERFCVESLKKEALMCVSGIPVKDRVLLSSEDYVDDLLKRMGIPLHLFGYRMTREAILMASEDPSLLNSIVGKLYTGVAEKFNSTSSRVERAIRNAIEVGWERADVNDLYKVFGCTIKLSKGKPTNTEFIATLVNEFNAYKRRNKL